MAFIGESDITKPISDYGKMLKYRENDISVDLYCKPTGTPSEAETMPQPSLGLHALQVHCENTIHIEGRAGLSRSLSQMNRNSIMNVILRSLSVNYGSVY